MWIEEGASDSSGFGPEEGGKFEGGIPLEIEELLSLSRLLELLGWSVVLFLLSEGPAWKTALSHGSCGSKACFGDVVGG